MAKEKQEEKQVENKEELYTVKFKEETLRNALGLLQRVQLQGKEVPAYNDVLHALQGANK